MSRDLFFALEIELFRPTWFRRELVSTHAHSLGTATSQLISFYRIISTFRQIAIISMQHEVEVCQGAVIYTNLVF